MKNNLPFITLGILIFFISCGEEDPAGPETGTIQGTVSDIDTKELINEVEIKINDKVVFTTDGNYKIIQIPTGNHKIFAKKDVYVLFVAEVTIRSGDNIHNIELEKMTSYCVRTTTVSHAGKIYNTVTIGDQCWLKENLNVGSLLNVSLEQTDNAMIEKYCYGNTVTNCDEYGGLYQWHEAMKYSRSEGSQGICPDGWHIPTFEEYKTFTEEVDNRAKAILREDQNGTNTSGFSALLSGFRDIDGSFHSLSGAAALWSSTENSYENASNIWFDGAQEVIFTSDDPKSWGFSVRCLKD